MAKREILPACLKYTNIVHNSIKSKLDLGIEAPNELNLLKNISMHTEELIAATNALDAVVANEPQMEKAIDLAVHYQERVIPEMMRVRKAADELETMVDKACWPFPTYTELLYNV